jgi:hypothetical protein
MTVFDRLEAQLLDAHPHRTRRALPRPAPRTIVAFAAAVAAVAVILAAAFSAGSPTATRRGPAATPGGVVPGPAVAILSRGARSRSAVRAATRLGAHHFRIRFVDNARVKPSVGTLVYFRPGRSAAASRVARLLRPVTLLPADRIILRAARDGRADVIVVVGRPA